jgi:RND family efflux transporter MFP subunit
VLTRVEAAPGSSVSAGEVLFAIVDASELWVRARVPEHDAPRIRADDDASFRILGLDEWLPIHVSGDDADAAVVTVGRTVDRRSRTVDLIYALRRPDVRLRVGATVRVAVPAGEATQSVSVPRSALVHDEGRDVVYVQVEGEAFEERVVRLGSRAGPWVAVEDGVGEGDRVVTRGANLVRLAARASSAPSHGHVH